MAIFAAAVGSRRGCSIVVQHGRRSLAGWATIRGRWAVATPAQGGCWAGVATRDAAQRDGVSRRPPSATCDERACSTSDTRAGRAGGRAGGAGRGGRGGSCGAGPGTCWPLILMNAGSNLIRVNPAGRVRGPVVLQLEPLAVRAGEKGEVGCGFRPSVLNRGRAGLGPHGQPADPWCTADPRAWRPGTACRPRYVSCLPCTWCCWRAAHSMTLGMCRDSGPCHDTDPCHDCTVR